MSVLFTPGIGTAEPMYNPVGNGNKTNGEEVVSSIEHEVAQEPINPRGVTDYSGNFDGNYYSNALGDLYQLAKDDPEHYMDSYLNAVLERENTMQAQNYYERMSNNQYSRAMEDIKRAGFNPYMALQGLSGAGSGSVSPAGVQAINGSSLKLDEKSANSQMWRAIAAIAGIAVTIAMMG